MRVLKTAYFHRLAESEGLSDDEVIEIVKELEKGLHNGDLGSLVFKKRIAIGSRGKRGGLRSIVAFKKEDRVIFMYGYPKNVLDNITSKEKQGYKKLSKYYMGMDEISLRRLLRHGDLIEVQYEQT